MSVLIGHASLGSNGATSGDAAGDQNGKEVCTRSWYGKNWKVLLRPTDSNIAEKSAKACEDACANSNIGYDQLKRNTLYFQAQNVKYDLSKIKTPCATDCSAFMTVCAIAGGVKELEYKTNAPNTSSMVDAFTKTGKYKKITDSKYLTSDKYLQRGDILVIPGSHTIMVLGNGDQVNKPIKLTYPCRGVDVAAWQVGLNYQMFRDRGTQFAILKVINKKNEKDNMFETHYSGFKSVGIPILGCYNYSYATTVAKAEEDARAVVKALNGRKMIVFLDVEDRVQQGIGETLINIINAYQKIIESHGLQFAIYSGMSFIRSYLVPYANKLKCKDVWVARYYLNKRTMYLQSALDNTKKPEIGGFNLIGWQYTSSGKVEDAYCGDLDLSIMYKTVQFTNHMSSGPIDYGIVNATSLRVRSEPNTSSEIKGYLIPRQKVLIYEITSDNWYRINNRADDPQWVCGDYIERGG